VEDRRHEARTHFAGIEPRYKDLAQGTAERLRAPYRALRGTRAMYTAGRQAGRRAIPEAIYGS